ncbi:MAG: hypothetical protein P1U50_01015 [Parvibaculaceae bacterium]|nr:hypothetical protein [Parvibaculaceae bacterium]
MSAALEWYKREPSEMLKDTFGLPAEVRGYYFILQDVIMSHNGRIRCHPQDVAGALGISVRKWNSVRKVLLEFTVEVKPDVFSALLKDDSEFISTLHTDDLLFKQRTYRNQKAENRAGPNKNNDLEKRASTTREELKESEEIKEITTLDAREGAPPGNGKLTANQLHRKLIDAVGEAATHRAPSQLDEIWLVESWIAKGWDLESLILPAIRDRCAKAAPRSIHSWKFFEDAIAQRKAEIDKPLPKMETGNGTGSYSHQQQSRAGEKRSTHLNAIRKGGDKFRRNQLASQDCLPVSDG